MKSVSIVELKLKQQSPASNGGTSFYLCCMKDNFSKQAHSYAKYRPGYPPELFDYILGFVKERNAAWDCGTGNGQSAKMLSDHFEKVFATDISQKQIDNAWQAPNIFYSVADEVHSGLPDETVSLVTVAQAIHWFNFEKFYTEVNRVAKPGAMLAVWTYSRLKISDEIEPIITDYHFNTLGDYWDAERKYVDDKYVDIPFPFKEIETPEFKMELNWSLEDLEGYFNTWSALQKYVAAHSFNPVGDIIQKIAPYWGDATERKIIFPIHLRLGVIK